MNKKKYRVWIKTDAVGSEIIEEVELNGNLSEEQVNEELKDVIFQFMEWGYEEVQDGDE